MANLSAKLTEKVLSVLGGNPAKLGQCLARILQASREEVVSILRDFGIVAPSRGRMHLPTVVALFNAANLIVAGEAARLTGVKPRFLNREQLKQYESVTATLNLLVEAGRVATAELARLIDEEEETEESAEESA